MRHEPHKTEVPRERVRSTKIFAIWRPWQLSPAGSLNMERARMGAAGCARLTVGGVTDNPEDPWWRPFLLRFRLDDREETDRAHRDLLARM